MQKNREENSKNSFMCSIEIDSSQAERKLNKIEKSLDRIIRKQKKVLRLNKQINTLPNNNNDVIINVQGSKIPIDDIGNEVFKKISQALNQM